MLLRFTPYRRINILKKIIPDGLVSVVAGQCGKRFTNPIYKEGDIKTAELMSPLYLAISKNCAFYFSDRRLHRIIKVADGKVNTVAGNGLIYTQHSNIMGYAAHGYSEGKAN